MTEFQTAALRVLRLADAELAGVDSARAGALAARLSATLSGDPLSRRPDQPPPPAVTGLALVLPQQLRLRDDGPPPALPALLALRQDGLRRWQVDASQNLELLVTDLDSGELRQWRPMHGDKRMQTPKPSGSGKAPDAINAAGVSTAVLVRDLADVLPADGRSTRLAVVALLHDWASNLEIVEVLGGPPVPPPAAEPSHGLKPSVQPRPLSEDGASLSRAGDGGLRLQWRLPPTRLPVADHGGAPAARVHLLFGRLDALQLVALPLVVPVQLDASQPRQLRAIADQTLTAEAIPEDLLTTSERVWLLAGDRVAGPLPLR